MASSYFASRPEQMFFYGLVALACLSEIAIRIYSDLNAHRSRKNNRKADSGSVFIVVAGLASSLCLSFFLSGNNFPYSMNDSFKLPHVFYFSGISIMAAGIFLRGISVWTLRKYFTVTVQIDKEHQLIRSGVYKHIRHPSYTGLVLFSAGVALSLLSLIAVICSIIICMICFNVRIRVEEKSLREQFGKEYDQYCAQTYRLIPFVW